MPVFLRLVIIGVLAIQFISDSCYYLPSFNTQERIPNERSYSMSADIRFSWLVPNQVVLVEFEGDVLSLDEFRDTAITLARLAETSDPNLNVIIDATALGRGPMQIRKMQEAAASFFESPKRNWTVIIQQESVAKFITSAFIQLFGTRTKMVKSLDQAIMLIKTKVPSSVEFLDEPQYISD